MMFVAIIPSLLSQLRVLMLLLLVELSGLFSFVLALVFLIHFYKFFHFPVDQCSF